MKKKVAEILIDYAKLNFAGLFLAGVLRQDVSPSVLVILGAAGVIIPLGIGLLLLWVVEKQSKNK